MWKLIQNALKSDRYIKTRALVWEIREYKYYHLPPNRLLIASLQKPRTNLTPVCCKQSSGHVVHIMMLSHRIKRHITFQQIGINGAHLVGRQHEVLDCRKRAEIVHPELAS